MSLQPSCRLWELPSCRNDRKKLDKITGINEFIKSVKFVNFADFMNMNKQNHIVVGFDYDTDRGYNRKFRYFCKKVLL